MSSTLHRASVDETDRVDQENVLFNVPWEVYEALDAARGEKDTPRLSYLEGRLELMTPSSDHDEISRMIHSLVFTWAEEVGVDLIAAGSWTQKSSSEKAGLEPDECYTLGTRRSKRPDIAVEVIWTSGSIEKLQIYRRLRIPEVWFWKQGQIHVYQLEGSGYVRRKRSALLPELDFKLIGKYVRREDQLPAIREYRAAIKRSRRH